MRIRISSRFEGSENQNIVHHAPHYEDIGGDVCDGFVYVSLKIYTDTFVQPYKSRHRRWKAL